MKTEDKILLGAGVIIVGLIAWNKLATPERASQADVNAYTIKAAQARDAETWFAPLQGKQAIAVTNADGSSTTYFVDDSDYNSMSRWERILYSWDVPLKNIFG